MAENRTLNEISSLLTWEAGEKKCAVFAQFWEAVRSCVSHLFIDNQQISLKLRKIKNCAASRPPRMHVRTKHWENKYENKTDGITQFAVTK